MMGTPLLNGFRKAFHGAEVEMLSITRAWMQVLLSGAPFDAFTMCQANRGLTVIRDVPNSRADEMCSSARFAEADRFFSNPKHQLLYFIP